MTLLNRRRFLHSCTGMAIAASASSRGHAESSGGEAIYNGIRLPAEWPPRVERLTREPAPVPYLRNPPAVIPIDTGRQLFVDDFLIERSSLERRFP